MFTAQWKYLCARCGIEHPAGALSEFDRNNEIRSVDCTQVPMDALFEEGDPEPKVMPRGTTPTDRCDNCFMVHSPGQKGCE